MSRSNPRENGYNEACRAARAIVESVIDSITQGIRDGEVTEDTLNDRIHEECDNALIYTSDQYVCVWGLRDTEDAIEEGLSSPQNFGEALAAQAFCNLRAEVSEHDFSDAFEMRADSDMESA